MLWAFVVKIPKYYQPKLQWKIDKGVAIIAERLIKAVRVEVSTAESLIAAAQVTARVTSTSRRVGPRLSGCGHVAGFHGPGVAGQVGALSLRNGLNPLPRWGLPGGQS